SRGVGPPITVTPSLNVIVPSDDTGAPPLVTVAVKVTSSPSQTGLCEVVRVVMVSIPVNSPTAKSLKVVKPTPVVLLASRTSDTGPVHIAPLYFLTIKLA